MSKNSSFHLPGYLWVVLTLFLTLFLVYSFITGAQIRIGGKEFGFTESVATVLSLSRQDENIPVSKFDSFGFTITEDDGKVDKRFFEDESCNVGDLRVAKINPGEKQIGICGCADEAPSNSLGHGWYCID